ncbi:MAG: aminotransferase class III-fold pyridoxal phosphate-dependent enzyme [Sinobacteraceae bacterium]|nr:aminotransferase class III-fold pyridoxal phosphate-dependent enzyme [Nevskiaceae bacterium]
MHERDELLARRRRALGAFAELSYDQPVRITHATGVWVHTAAGERLLDVYNNVPHVGHAHPRVAAAIAAQAQRVASNTRYLDERLIEYSERLLATFPAHLDTCLFVNSGSEANDVAWQIAKAHTANCGALVMSHAYHGITDSVAALSTAIRRDPAPQVGQLPPPRNASDAENVVAAASALIEQLQARGCPLAALLIDSAMTSTGVYDPPSPWGALLSKAVHDAGALVIADEVQIGLGRCGSHLWGFERRGLSPDLVTLGKPIANGYPLGIVVLRRALLEPFQRDTGFFSTFGGNQVAAAAGLAVLEVVQQEGLRQNAERTGGYFLARLRELAAQQPLLREIRGSGLLLGAELGAADGLSPAHFTRGVLNALRARGILTGADGPEGNVLKLRPPLPFLPEHVDRVITALQEVLQHARP